MPDGVPVESNAFDEKLSLSKDIVRLGKTGNAPYISYPHGIGDFNQIAELNEYGTNTGKPWESKSQFVRERFPLTLNFWPTLNEAGRFHFQIDTPGEYPSRDNEKIVYEPRGPVVTPGELITLDAKIRKSIEDSEVSTRVSESKINHKRSDYSFSIQINNRKILLQLRATTTPRNPNVYYISFYMDFDENEPAEDQINFFVTNSTKVVRILCQNKEDNFIVNPNAAKTFLEITEEEVSEKKRSQPINEAVYVQREGETKRIMGKMQPSYIEQIAVLNKKRIEMLDDKKAEPDFTGKDFPFTEIASYDFSCQPFLNESEAEAATMSISRVLEEQGIKLDEPIVKIHYVELFSPKIEGKQSYELLTTNPKRISPFSGTEIKNYYDIRTTIGSTHSHIEDTTTSRSTAGAKYPPERADVYNSIEDPRGMVLETLSGKKYAIWGLWRAHTLLYSAGMQDLEQEKELLDPTLLADMEKRYGISILHGSTAETFLEQTVMDSLIDRAAVEWFQKNKNKTTHDLLRAKILMRSGISPE